MTITASCGHLLKDGEEAVIVRIGGEDCDAVGGFAPAVDHFAYCAACANEAKTLPEFIPNGTPDEWWFDVGYSRWLAEHSGEVHVP